MEKSKNLSKIRVSTLAHIPSLKYGSNKFFTTTDLRNCLTFQIKEKYSYPIGNKFSRKIDFRIRFLNQKKARNLSLCEYSR